MQQISSTHTHTKKKNYSNTHYNSTNSMKKIKTLKVAREKSMLLTKEERYELLRTCCLSLQKPEDNGVLRRGKKSLEFYTQCKTKSKVKTFR